MTQGEMALTQAVTGTAGGPAGMFTDPKVTNPPFTSHFTHVVPTDANVQRGYMRLLGQVLQANLGKVEDTPEGDDATRALKELGAKLDFQFNPNQLSRAVTARTDTQLWINQSPSELLTPGLGDMSFQWQMLFNREEEVQRYYNAYGRWDKAGYHAEGANSPTLDALLEDPAEPMVAERIGVLADIMVMDQITGQRLTAEAIKFSEKWALVRPDEDGNVSPEEPISEDRQKSLLSANLTNAAFLIPNPIRVVFSENFMVDGYVNTVAVNIQKFSPDMVPTVCTVDISMHALYQGFARRSTVFTTLANMEDDYDGLIPGNNPFDDESANAEAAVVGSTEETLQVQGLMGTPILAGIDHSPSDTWGDQGSMKMDRWKARTGIPYTDHLPKTRDRDQFAVKGGRSLKIQHRDTGQNAITFGIVSNLRDSGLGTFLRNNGSTSTAKEWFTNVKPNMRVRGYLGLSLRARLKAEDQASLRVLWEEGDDNGFSDFSKANQDYTSGEWQDPTSPAVDTHFFDRWSKEQRKMLFAAGIDNFSRGYSGATNAAALGGWADLTANQNSGYYTRSFPILEVAPGYYGDHFYKSDFEYGPATINFEIGNDSDEGWIWGGTKDTPHAILGEKWDFSIANGFYTASASLFPAELTLTNASTSNVDHTYEIQYQQALVLRVRMEVKDTGASSASNGYVPVSDTGVLFVYPRKEATGIIDDVDGAGFTDRGVAGSIELQGGTDPIRGVYGSGIEAHIKDGKWLLVKDGSSSGDPGDEGLGNDMFYDGLFQHDGNTIDNIKRYSEPYKLGDAGHVSLGGVMISSKDTLINNQPVDF